MPNPDLYLFSPTCETAVANGSETYMAPLILREFETALSCLPMFFTKSDDLILSPLNPSNEFLKQLHRIQFPVPNCISKMDILSRKISLGHIVPWGWSPAVHFQLKEIKTLCSDDFKKSKVFNWSQDQKILHERITSLELLKKFIAKYGNRDYCNENVIPKQIYSTVESEEFVNDRNGSVLKSPISSSGRGIQFIRNNIINNSTRQWIKSILKQSGYLVAEPLLDKLYDISFQFKITTTGETTYLGHTWFSTNRNGMYQGHYLNKELGDIQKIAPAFDDQFLSETGHRLREIINESVYTLYYEGFLGIDGMIFKEDNQLKLHPCLEINCRPTMGLVALQIEKYIHPEANGKFEIYTDNQMPYPDFCYKMERDHPVILKDGLFHQGFVTLNDPQVSKVFGAYILLQ